MKKDLGFKCGLEIHQQLDCGKLYCHCPTLVRDPNPLVRTITRRLRPVVGESGSVDVAAAHEAEKSKLFIYEFRDTSTCLVDLDEEPPQPMNPRALAAALQVASLVGARVVDEIQVMRKIVVDGSNVTGFQRTALVAMDGTIETSQGPVKIDSICLEEESAQKLEEDEGVVRYRLDRLGVPLIEIATDASIKSPEHAQECAKKLGMILRSTKEVKRGIGSIRQDVNVSIKGGARVEIKGFQDLRSIPKVIDGEIARQQTLIAKGKKVSKEVRKAEADFTTTFLRPMPGAARLYPETDVLPVRITAEMLSSVGEVELLSDITERITTTHKIPKELAGTLVKQGKGRLFDELCGSLKTLKPSFIADLLLGAEKQIKKESGKDVKVSDQDFRTLLKALDAGRIAKESISQILAEAKPVEKILSKYELMSDAELEKRLKKIISLNKGAPFNALIGKAMGELRGKASGKKIAQLLKKLTS